MKHASPRSVTRGFTQVVRLVHLSLLATLTMIPVAHAAPATSRDPWIRPFRADSIWNTPIGSHARYVPSGYPEMKASSTDPAYFLKLDARDPLVDHIETTDWRRRCSSKGRVISQLNLPPDFMIPDARQNSNGGWSTPNNGWEFLLPDGRTLYCSGAGARCERNGPIFGHGGALTTNPEPENIRLVDIYGDGLRGGHGASKLPRLGGALRKGELSPHSGPIRHALDLVLYTKYAYGNKQDASLCYRWPASGADRFALDPAKKDRYIGTNPEMRIGSLLALTPDTTPEQLGITSPEGRKIFQALQDWGGYWTDDSAWPCNYLTIAYDAHEAKAWLDSETGKAEFSRMMAALHVVANNGPDSIGGGGTPRAPLHAPLIPPAS